MPSRLIISRVTCYPNGRMFPTPRLSAFRARITASICLVDESGGTVERWDWDTSGTCPAEDAPATRKDRDPPRATLLAIQWNFLGIRKRMTIREAAEYIRANMDEHAAEIAKERGGLKIERSRKPIAFNWS